MANILIRAGTNYLTSGTPERLARPAYTWYETVRGTVTSPGGSGWVQVPVYQFIEGGPNVIIGYQIVYTGTGTGYVTNNVTHTIRHDEPAQEYAPGTPSVRVEDPPMGWNSYAHTIAFMERHGEATFKVPANVSAAALGFTREPRPVAGLGHLLHGLIFTGGKAYLKSVGTLLGTYLGSDVFKIKNSGGTVSYLKGATPLITEPATIPVGSNLYLGAALFRATDQASDPLLVELREGSAAMVEPPMAILSSDYDYASAQLVEAEMTLSATVGSTAVLVEAEMRMLASDYAYGSAQLVEAPMTMAAFGESVVIDSGNYADLLEAQMIMSALGFTGSAGSAAMSEAPMAMLSADYAYASAMLVEAPMLMIAYPEPANFGYMLQLLTLDIQMQGESAEVADMAVNMAFSFAMDGFVAVTQPFPIGMVLSFPMTGIAESFGVMPISMTLALPMVPQLTLAGRDLSVWAVNLSNSASTSYSNYPFNSFARIGGRYYGAKHDGVYDLDADTDAGEPIRAAISMGAKDFGSPNKKTLVECFLAMSGTGPLIMRLLVEGADFNYQTSDSSPYLQQQRLKFGKGKELQGSYITPIVYNVAGADFELAEAMFHVADSERKL